MARASPIVCSMKHLVVCSGLLIGLGKKKVKFHGITDSADFAEIFRANSGSTTA